MQNKLEEIRIEFAPEFKRNLKRLAKKYRHIRSDIEPVTNELQKGIIIGRNRRPQRYKRSGH